MKPPSLTIGIEEEYQIVDPVSRELRSYITEILHDEVMVMGEVKPELHQSIVEVGTKVCNTPADACAELKRHPRAEMFETLTRFRVAVPFLKLAPTTTL